MYLHGMRQRCPFPKDVSDTFEIVSMVVASGIQNVSQDEISLLAKRAQAKVDNDISANKDESCKKAQGVAQATAAEVTTLLNEKQ